MSVARQPVGDEHELYPSHEEDSVPEKPTHERQVRYLREVLEARLPDCWVTGDVCMYWAQHAYNQYAAPDVLVVEDRAAAEPPNVYLSWIHPPALMVIEVGSKSTFKEDEGPKVDKFLFDLSVREYVYYRPHVRRALRSLRMWALAGESVVETVAAPGARLASTALGLEFGLDEENFLRVYEPDGTMILSPRELAAQERARADALAAEVERLREELKRRDGGGDARSG